MNKLKYFFQSNEHDNQAVESLRRKVFYSSAICIIALTLLLFLHYLFFGEQKSAAIKTLLILSCLSIFMYSSAVIFMYFTKKRRIAGHFILLCSGSIIFIMIAAVGGGLSTTVITPFLYAAILMGFCILGLKGGVFWAVVFTAGFLLLDVMESQGFVFPYTIRSQNVKLTHLVVWICTLLLLSLYLIAYEWILFNLANEHRLKHEHKTKQTTLASPACISAEELQYFLTQAIQRSARYKDMLGIHIVDIHLQDNDPYQQLMQNVYQRISKLNRSSDSTLKIGEHSFVLITENISSQAGHELMTEILQEELLPSYPIDDTSITLSYQIKAYLYPADIKSVNDIGIKIDG